MPTTPPQLTITRHIAAPRERVFNAWLDSEAMAHWMRADTFDDSIVTVDPRVGGGFRVVMVPKNREPVEHWGEYLRIEPPSLLSFTWISKNTDRWPSEVTSSFTSVAAAPTWCSPIAACRSGRLMGTGPGGQRSWASSSDGWRRLPRPRRLGDSAARRPRRGAWRLACVSASD